MNTKAQEMPFNEKVKLIRESVRELLTKCQVHQADLMIPVKIVVDPICPCKKEKPQDGLSHKSFIRCRHCEGVFHTECFEEHKSKEKAAQEYPLNNREKEFIQKYIKRYFQYQEDKSKQHKQYTIKNDQKGIEGETTTDKKRTFPENDPNLAPAVKDDSNAITPTRQTEISRSQEIFSRCEKCERGECMCIFVFENSRKKVKLNEANKPPDPPKNPPNRDLRPSSKTS